MLCMPVCCKAHDKVLPGAYLAAAILVSDSTCIKPELPEINNKHSLYLTGQVMSGLWVALNNHGKKGNALIVKE